MVEGSIDTGQSSFRAVFGAASGNNLQHQVPHSSATQFATSSQLPSMEQQFYASPSVGIGRITESEQKIITQAEFYLSEDYLTKNAYLLRQVLYRLRAHL